MSRWPVILLSLLYTGAAAAASDGGADPLVIRVLEREKARLASLEVFGGKLYCDEAPLGSRATLSVDSRELVVGAGRCATVSARGAAVAITIGELSRRYRGQLRVSVQDAQLAFFNQVSVEEYLPGVVGSETLPGAPEALAAQAVVSRTFALASRGRHRGAGYDLCDLTHCQLYRGVQDERQETVQAVERTRGELLLVGGVVLRPAFFHASCGGATSSAAEIFGEDGLEAQVSDAKGAGGPLCREAPDFDWSWRVDRMSLARGLGLREVGVAFEALRRDGAGRVVEARVFGRRTSGRDLLAAVGRAFGYRSLRSLKVRAQEVEGVVLFTGNGLGHGVGLCQAGARAAALEGWNYQRILGHYFPTSSVRSP